METLMMAVVVKRMGRDRGKKRRVSGEAIKRREGKRRSTFPTPNLLMKKDVPNKQQIKDMKLVSCPKCPINFANSSPPIERERRERVNQITQLYQPSSPSSNDSLPMTFSR